MRHHDALRLVLVAVLAAFASACTGVISEAGGNGDHGTRTGGTMSGAGGSGSGTSGSGSGGAGTTTGGGPGPFACQSATIEPGPTTMQLLTNEQYRSTVH